MKTKKIGLLAFFIGIFVIPFVSVKADIQTYYTTLFQGSAIFNYDGGDGFAVSYDYTDKSYATSSEQESDIANIKNELLDWCKTTGLDLSQCTEANINVYGPDTSYYKIVNGIETYTTEEEATIKRVTYMVEFFAEKDMGKDTRELISKVEVSGVTTDFKDGDKPVYTAKTGDSTYKIDYEMWSSRRDHVGFCNYSDEKENNVAKEKDYYFEKFQSGVVYSHSVIVKVVDPFKYKFTNDTKVYIDKKEYKGEFYNGIIISKYILDLASTTISDKNYQQVIDLAEEVMNNAVEEEHPGLTDELANELSPIINNHEYDRITTRVDIKEIPETDIENVKEKIKDKVTSDMNIVSYLDISIPVLIDGEQKGYITKLINDAKITIEAPTNIPKVKDGYERTFAVIRLHNGEVTVIPVTVNSDGTLSFESDSFSEYVLTYTDNIIPTEDDTKNPNTSDNILSSAIILLLSVIGLLSIRKLRNN